MSAISKTEIAHRKFREGKYAEALQLYTDALLATDLAAHQIALHSNRAACYLKLQKFNQAVEECSHVLELDSKHTGALMLRAQTLVALKDYHSAVFDVNRLLEVNPDSNIYRAFEARLRTQLSLAPIPEAENELELHASESDTPPDSPLNRSLKTSSPNSPLPSTSSVQQPQVKGWEAISKPKGHSGVDYSRWSGLGDDESDEEDDDQDSQPQYRYRLRTVGLRGV